MKRLADLGWLKSVFISSVGSRLLKPERFVLYNLFFHCWFADPTVNFLL